MRISSFLMVLFFMLIACAETGDNYIIIEFGSSNEKPSNSEAVLYKVTEGEKITFLILHPNSEEKIKQTLYSLGKGDVVELKKPHDFGYKKEKSPIFQVLDFRNSKEVEKFEDGIGKLEEIEVESVLKYLFNSKSLYSFEKALFVHWISKEANSTKGIKNSIYRMDMECELLDGTKVFSTDKSNMLFEFNKSMPGQITVGLDYIIKQMGEGDEVEVVVPSALSFGEKEIGEGIIPPNSPLYYKIKIVEIII